MPLIAVDSLSLKIQSFLRNSGFTYDDRACSQTQLLRYFEDEYGLELMPLLEQEWVDEQVERDLTDGDFKHLRLQVDQNQLEKFDEDVAFIWDA